MGELHQNVIGSTQAGYVLTTEEVKEFLRGKYPADTHGAIDFGVYVSPSSG